MNYTYTTLLMPPLIIIFAYLFFGIWDFANCSCLKSAARDLGRVASTRKVGIQAFFERQIQADFFFPTETIVLN